MFVWRFRRITRLGGDSKEGEASYISNFGCWVGSCYRQLREWGLTRVADASGKCSGGEQTMKRTSGGREAAVINSIKIVVAIAVYTPPLMALQHIWGWFCGALCLARRRCACRAFVRIHLSFAVKTAIDTGHHEKVWIYRPTILLMQASAQRARCEYTL